MRKTKNNLHMWIPDWLVERLRRREVTHGAQVFREREISRHADHRLKLAGQIEEDL
jgi:hypothetical protein